MNTRQARDELLLMGNVIFLLETEAQLSRTRARRMRRALVEHIVAVRETTMQMAGDHDGHELVEFLRDIRTGQFSLARRVMQLCRKLGLEWRDELACYSAEFESEQVRAMLGKGSRKR